MNAKVYHLNVNGQIQHVQAVKLASHRVLDYVGDGKVNRTSGRDEYLYQKEDGERFVHLVLWGPTEFYAAIMEASQTDLAPGAEFAELGRRAGLSAQQ